LFSFHISSPITLPFDMTFPKLLIITDSARMKPSFDGALLNACLSGAKWFCVREKSLAPREILALFARTQRIAEKFGAHIFLNGRADLTRAAHADGLHLPEGEISVADARLTLGFHLPCGVSVHSLESAQNAAREGASYLIFGPIFPTSSHPEAVGVGVEALREVCESVTIPVFAVGGINTNNATSCLQAGAAGVAVISAVWEAPDVTRAVRELRAALGEVDAPTHGDLARESNQSPPKTGLAALITPSHGNG
jgi:thiamine-phosphate pyrophosphorylase